MDGLNQLTAAGHVVNIGGRDYRLGPLTLEDYGEIENRILAKRPDPLALVIDKLDRLDRKQQEMLLARAYDQAVKCPTVTIDELQRWRNTPEGFCYRFWLMIRKHHEEVGLQDAVELIEQLSSQARAELNRRVEDCGGLPAGNS
ncbi:hypothetical protein ES707_09507 [subsurface metagenome]